MGAISAAAGATVIAVEDLTTLETRGHGRVNNNRAAHQRAAKPSTLSHTLPPASV
ncbi:hypothetical protein JOJ86_000503 [Rhodococcus percolatus]|nr:hypothetical protein Rwratislav_24104 [Rhodococcus wratislaviensis IFP 2016]MBA8961359.1 hypothetical protein [Rhodococcus opacus]MBP2202777.1 hypothetical protein [Rhodococcus opacus]